VKSEEDVVARVRELRTSMHDTSRN
jgi:hypothetical protein